MSVKRIRRQGRELLATLTEPPLVSMSGTVGAAEVDCHEMARKLEELPIVDSVASLRVAAEGLAVLLAGGNDVAKTVVDGARAASEWGEKAATAHMRALIALQEAAHALQEADAALIEAQGGVNLASGHLNYYLMSLGVE